MFLPEKWGVFGEQAFRAGRGQRNCTNIFLTDLPPKHLSQNICPAPREQLAPARKKLGRSFREDECHLHVTVSSTANEHKHLPQQIFPQNIFPETFAPHHGSNSGKKLGKRCFGEDVCAHLHVTECSTHFPDRSSLRTSSLKHLLRTTRATLAPARKKLEDASGKICRGRSHCNECRSRSYLEEVDCVHLFLILLSGHNENSLCHTIPRTHLSLLLDFSAWVMRRYSRYWNAMIFTLKLEFLRV